MDCDDIMEATKFCIYEHSLDIWMFMLISKICGSIEFEIITEYQQKLIAQMGILEIFIWTMY